MEMNVPIILKSKVNFIDGNNFSGRSDFLKKIIASVKDEKSLNPLGVMVGEIPSNYISGLAPTVKDEINLHTSNNIKSNYRKRLIELLHNLSFEKHYDKNPFLLSGGEQAVLTIVSALLLEPKRLAIDLTLEQLNFEWRDVILKELSNDIHSEIQLAISDNRFSEYSLNSIQVDIQKPSHSTSISKTTFSNILCPSILNTKSIKQNIVLKDLSFGYSRKDQILKKITYEFESGKIYHLKGINGAGKSTLSKILTGVLKPTSGTIIIEGKNYDAYKYPGKIIGYSFQNPDEQLFSSNIRNEIIPKAFLKSDYDIINAETFLSSFGLTLLVNKHPSEMPFVIRKRIALAATLANNRAWYILDEPTIGQDDKNVNELVKIINLLVSQGKGIILISHSNAFINYFENLTVVSLNNGSLN